MKPAVGEIAPDFTAPVIGPGETEAAPLTLSSLRGERVVLVFYPKDRTPGCTQQACALRDAWQELRGKARVFGVSADSVKSHGKFIAAESLPYPLISDEEKTISNAYGVWVEKSMMGRKFMGIERTTFVLGAEGHIETILEKVSPAKHLDLLREALA